MTASADADRVLSFWFEDLRPAQWWKTDPDMDAAIAERFGALHAALAEGVSQEWLATPETALAAVIVLDQFSRNMFRDSPRAFAQDAAARAVADAAIAAGFDQQVEPPRRAFFYLPFMHSESVGDQARCLALYEAMGDENHIAHARAHKDVIDRFGRFPKRNEALGRASTPEEAAHIAKTPGII